MDQIFDLHLIQYNILDLELDKMVEEKIKINPNLLDLHMDHHLLYDILNHNYMDNKNSMESNKESSMDKEQFLNKNKVRL